MVSGRSEGDCVNFLADTLPDCRPVLQARHPRKRSGRLLIVLFSIALALVTAVAGGRWIWLVGGAAALISLLSLVPPLSRLVKPICAYIGVWLVFNYLRAYGDDTIWANDVLSFVPRIEAWLFGGRLPSTVLQERFFRSSAIDSYDYGWTIVYLSFFIAPHLAAVLLLWRNRSLFWHYLLATAVLFALALLGFFAIPTSPPWLVTEAVPEAGFAQIWRITQEVLSGLDLPFRLFNTGQGETMHISEVRLEPNAIAAMPSIHFASTVLIVFPARSAGRLWAGVTTAYAALMAIALVYLGEHYVLDIVVGGMLARSGWIVVGKCLDGEHVAR